MIVFQVEFPPNDGALGRSAIRTAGTANDSTKGSDIIGFKFATDAPHHPNDELFIFESKSGMTKTDANRLQDAITDSIKDHLREAMTLNAMKQRMLVRGQQEEADKWWPP